MPATFAGQPLMDAAQAVSECARLGLPTAWWAGKPNAWTNRLGARSGEGWVLMTAGDLAAIDLAASHDLVLSPAEPRRGGLPLQESDYRVTHKSLHVASARCVSPGEAGDATRLYLVELADRRRLKALRHVNEAYNLRQSGVSGYVDGSGTWTWQTLINDLWSKADLGAAPTLPGTPDGAPENFDFRGAWAAIDALELVLRVKGWSLSLDTLTDTFSVVELGGTDAAKTARLADLDAGGWAILDEDRYAPAYGRVAESVVVLFPKVFADAADGVWLGYHEEAAAGVEPDAEADSVAVLVDDLAALYDASGALTNGAALTTRAEERADDYYRMAAVAPLAKTYTLTHPDLAPGAVIDEVRHGDRGRGMVTAVTRLPQVPGDALGPPPPPGDGVADGGEPSSHCDLAALSTTDCLQLTVGDETFLLVWDTTSWVSADSYTYPSGSGTWELYFADGMLHLKLDGLELLNCGDGCWRGGPLTGHAPDSETYCAGETFTACVECACCLEEGWYCVDLGDGCEPAFLTWAEVCAAEPDICSGPYADEAAALAVCGPPETPINNSCCSGVDIPRTLYMHFTVGTGTYACANGTTVSLAYNDGTSKWEYTGAWCAGGTATFAVYCEAGAWKFDLNIDTGGFGTCELTGQTFDTFGCDALSDTVTMDYVYSETCFFGSLTITVDTTP